MEKAKTELMKFQRKLNVKAIEYDCKSCGVQPFQSISIKPELIVKDNYYCASCGREETFLLHNFRAKDVAIDVNLSPIWDRFHTRLKHYTLRAAKDPEQLITTRCIEVMHEASTFCGRQDVADFTLADLKFVVDYIYAIAEKAGIENWSANDVLTIKGVLDDYNTIRPLVYQAQMVANVLSPTSVLVKLFGAASIGSMMVLPARAKRAGTVYAFGYLSFLLMSPK